MVCHRDPSPSSAILRYTEQKVYLSHARRQVRVVLKQKHIVDRRRRKSEEWT